MVVAGLCMKEIKCLEEQRGQEEVSKSSLRLGSQKPRIYVILGLLGMWETINLPITHEKTKHGKDIWYKEWAQTDAYHPR